MPDVVIWLLSGTKRIAYFRIPAYDVLYSPLGDSCGQFCGRVFNMFMKVTDELILSLKSLERDSVAVIVCNDTLLTQVSHRGYTIKVTIWTNEPACSV